MRRIFMPTTSSRTVCKQDSDLDAKEEATLPVTGKIARDGPNSSSGKTFLNWLMMTKAEWEDLIVRLEGK
jgi:hypothetical protein